MADVAGLVLAGGRGSRLGGVNKALLDLGGRTSLERVLAVLSELQLSDLVVVTNDDVLAEVGGARVIFDPEPHAGVLPALLAGLESSKAEWCVTAACDMPFLSAALYRYLLEQAADSDVAIPQIAGQFDPMCAAYRRATCAQVVRTSLARGQRRMISFFDQVRVLPVPEPALRQVAPDLLALFNINTPEDLAWARALVEQREGAP